MEEVALDDSSASVINNRNGLPWRGYDKYFKLIRVNEKNNYIVQCRLCLNQQLSVSKTSAYNMKLHIERRHGSKSTEFSNHLREAKQKNEKAVPSETCSLKQSVLTVQNGSVSNCPSKKTIDEALVDWIVQGMHAFSEVERPSFVALWQSLTKQKLMCRKTLMTKIDRNYELMKSNLLGTLSKIDFVCTTADCWTVFSRSYLGMTCHWIDPESLCRKNVALSCHRIVGKHTFDVLAKDIFDVLLTFQIQNKVCLTVTDSGSNFMKAFRDFGKNRFEDGGEDEEEDEGEDDNLEEVVQVRISDILSTNDSDELMLPPHRKCSAHMLSLIGHKDIEGINDPVYRKHSRSSFAKCQGLWNKSKQSVKAADIIREHLGVNLVVPNATRWNALYKAVTWLCKFVDNENDDRLHQVCDKIGLPRLKTTEVDFLKEYCGVMEPLAMSLDILQGDKNVSIGYLLPTLHRLLHFLEKKLESNLLYCSSLAQAIKSSVENRFRDDLWDKDLVLAACIHPRFKLAWIEDGAKKEEATTWLKRTVADLYPQDSVEEESVEDDDPNKGFFNFTSKPEKERSSVEELDSFLKEGLKPFESIKDFPSLKKICIKLNTPVPSSAAVERLFSCGGNICTAKRAKLTDTNFEKQLLLKFNSFT